MSLVSHKKSCVELMNFWVFTQPIPNFFFKVQNWDSQQRAETAAISNFEISSNSTIPKWHARNIEIDLTHQSFWLTENPTTVKIQETIAQIPHTLPCLAAMSNPLVTRRCPFSFYDTYYSTLSYRIINLCLLSMLIAFC